MTREINGPWSGNGSNVVPLLPPGTYTQRFAQLERELEQVTDDLAAAYARLEEQEAAKLAAEFEAAWNAEEPRGRPRIRVIWPMVLLWAFYVTAATFLVVQTLRWILR
jgi:type VI protein secretion system component VasF